MYKIQDKINWTRKNRGNKQGWGCNSEPGKTLKMQIEMTLVMGVPQIWLQVFWPESSQ